MQNNTIKINLSSTSLREHEHKQNVLYFKTSSQARTRLLRHKLERPNATKTRILQARQAISRKWQIFHNQTCQFLHARGVASIFIIKQFLLP